MKYHQWGEKSGSRGGDADGEGVPVAGVGGGRAHAGRARRLRPAHRRRAGHGQRGDSLRRRRGHRLPHEDDGAGYSVARFGEKQDRLTRAIERETRFGIGAHFKERRAHEVLDADWSVSPITKQNKDKAWSQLGTSGSGNHFVEFGLFTAHSKINDLEPGVYVALLSHSGSRGTGAAVCDHYSKLAFSQFPDLPSELKRLAWLSLDSQEGQEYWNAMELMGQYAAANHACIHRHIAEHLGATGLA